MYPNLYYVFKELFHIDLPALKVINTFGFFVAIAFLICAALIVKELKRRQALGIFTYEDKKVTIGEPATTTELVLNFVLGFAMGYKILGVFVTKGALNNPQEFLFSGQGNFIAGIAVGALFAFLKWQEKNKVKLAKPETRTIRIWPSDRVGDIIMIAAGGGFVGAKIFDNLENWNRFIQDPIGNLLSPSGLTYYGGLIVASLSLWYYFRKHNMRFIDVADALAPILMLSYGLGRIGCQVAGDGDWGIVNTKPKPFSWMPDWFWSYDYAHNVNKEGVPLPNCTWDDYCTHLPQGVFPTPLYEIIVSVILFFFLWSVRKKITTPGKLFGLYLFVNGWERLLIEQIRVNTKYDIFGFHPTQAEIIATVLIVGGALLFFKAKDWIKPTTNHLAKN
ncbi:prolipoprotein diacylglyceryl transferase [Rhizosphaericola mali]|uniref:Diacylglyceryl transferase n=1 Tax=Rhizosphaericola mali TaxID=2545455 RepID=A0A5P2G2A6_9BACT|nr:prolipoprotein diacylglyceryl transferase family protein [Rhizosphaericola mali]QES87962.1 diacylglyceryl transferase [Rhizosphaericola mali]